MMKNRPEVLTFGCRLNSVESETMQRHAEEAGLEDVVIVNTCAVTAEAERQVGQAIRKLKRENPSVKVMVTGCSAQIDPKKYEAMAEVDGVIPNDRKLDPKSFEAITGRRNSHFSDKTAVPMLSPVDGAMQRAFVQIQNGCDNRCTFCVIPFGRGASRSVSFERVVDEVRQRVDEGFQEIVLTGVDLASYGRDLPGEPTLGFLTGRVLTSVPDLKRLRLSSLDPAGLDEDLWELLGDEPRFMPHWHLSLQSGDDRILTRMKRRHTRDQVFRLVDRARTVRPDMVFGADIITGFPTETDAMFENTQDLVRRCGITWLHVFPYSARKGTPAARMPQVPVPVRKERATKLRALADEAARRYHESLIGKTFEVLVEKNGIGCTRHFAKIKLRGPWRVGALMQARCVAIEKEGAVAEVVTS
ncbi:MAG: tRNA (N(6)-L-threonylcarbamoyladenosine(37)-C(2))-methylthiotransferase MtaB [Alphaproteobacteria bacterium]|nr:tRNA (N(6)-L-threonylcarbamoyladenosine(37)-C(2))-methylthiotransferase MtaB [Alphaproteobacteria bacterium]